MKIQAAVTRKPHASMSLETLTLEEPRDDEILVRLVATGICHTDIGMRDQAFPVPQPIVLGHEGAGIVERTGGAVTKVRAGDHVLMTFNHCGHCPSCQHEWQRRVHGNFFGQSSFATYALCHEANVVKVRDDVPLAGLAPLACGIQTGAGAIVNVLRPGPGNLRRAELAGQGKAAFVQIDADDGADADQARGQDGAQSDRSGSKHGQRERALVSSGRAPAKL